MITFSIERADAPGVPALLQASDDFHNELYPPEDNYLLDVASLLAPGVTVVVARDGETAVGMGALVEHGDGTAELKRMFVKSALRGKRIADRILQSLEEVAREHAVTLLQLETGPLQPVAITFYVSRGYEATGPFADYPCTPSSLFFAKAL